MVQLYADILLLIMLELQDDISSLHSCILVNRSWSRIAIPFTPNGQLRICQYKSEIGT
ncbi:hypothetical protein GLOIN_2v1583458 [Rhizophagus irregularis DAOM 181602=DAOM 197198]|uniref:F-box domain-containing protein n=1 Tax=Rhizophagus irregularis (strain DAOM 181602 / DAOM 197198 / MUCL 43194) TaxID=747089 RepID=A0A2P4Q7K8_RHIID|nr:hypothetical protein GLOIN_2v1583458 [Rhizophagus irregularis DAOM 181602=DAOM 197198]POG73620.1 hypothetical protein GLOIN_2v1583458 [Rhizophagus irregularis DAOM 181602=DAOM 197198]|eukprot:XP_025180486.1 hypothetical protein GLOIN_2v1583458 [Rhizophagus irregularis DAOM 181602=DAOM 197198]